MASPHGGHFTESQERRWGGRYLKPGCQAIAEAHADRGYLADATAYAARRGHISSRLAAGESVPVVAEDCGTSRKTITGHYHEDLGEEFPRPTLPSASSSGRLRPARPRPATAAS